MKITEYHINISRLLQPTLNFRSLILAILLVFFLASKTYPLALLSFSINLAQSSYCLLAAIFSYFLYFVFISLFIKYFQLDYHFSLHYFIYIGTIFVVSLIIIVHKSAVYTIIYDGVLLLLFLALCFANTEKNKVRTIV